MNPSTPRYANWWSRIVLAGQFERQFIVPCEPRPAVKRAMNWFERYLLRPQLADIAVRQPIFIVGLHRSGTTMVQDVLCRLPDVAYITNVMNVYPESPCAAEWVRRHLRLDISGDRYLDDDVPVNGGTPNEGVSFWRRWLREDPHDYRYVEQSPEAWDAGRRRQMCDDIRRILWCFRPTARRFFCKNPCLTPHVGWLAEMFPDARILHVVRDPRDCVPSMIRFYRRNVEQLEQIRRTGRHGVYDTHPFMPYARLPHLPEYVAQYGPESIETVARLWCDGVEWIDRHRQRIGQFLEVRYEDIVSDPRTAIQRMAEFCELDLQAAAGFLEQQIATIRPRSRRSPNEQSRRIEEICRSSLQRLGYADGLECELLSGAATRP